MSEIQKVGLHQEEASQKINKMKIGSGYSSSSNYDSSSNSGSEQKTLKFTNISPKKGAIGRPESKNSR